MASIKCTGAKGKGLKKKKNTSVALSAYISVILLHVIISQHSFNIRIHNSKYDKLLFQLAFVKPFWEPMCYLIIYKYRQYIQNILIHLVKYIWFADIVSQHNSSSISYVVDPLATSLQRNTCVILLSHPSYKCSRSTCSLHTTSASRTPATTTINTQTHTHTHTRTHAHTHTHTSGGLVVRTLASQARGRGLDPRAG